MLNASIQTLCLTSTEFNAYMIVHYLKNLKPLLTVYLLFTLGSNIELKNTSKLSVLELNLDWERVSKFSFNQKLESISRKITFKLVSLLSLRFCC